MARCVLHPLTERSIAQFGAQPAHAVMITGPAGGGKTTVAQYIAQRLLVVDEAKLQNHPHIMTISPVDGKAIPIDNIRELQRFMTLKIPGANTDGHIARIAIIENAHLMTTEAQNALLKTLEEPPLDTVIMLTASSPEAMLATIQSRVRTLAVIPPALDEVKSYFSAAGHLPADIDKALMLSGGLPGLTYALLTSEQEHPLFEATNLARSILQGTAFERLKLVDSLTKQKALCADVLYIIGLMSRMAIQRGSGGAAGQRWQRIMKAAYAATIQLQHNTQPKLVLTNLMLTL